MNFYLLELKYSVIKKQKHAIKNPKKKFGMISMDAKLFSLFNDCFYTIWKSNRKDHAHERRVLSHSLRVYTKNKLFLWNKEKH